MGKSVLGLTVVVMVVVVVAAAGLQGVASKEKRLSLTRRLRRVT